MERRKTNRNEHCELLNQTPHVHKPLFYVHTNGSKALTEMKAKKEKIEGKKKKQIVANGA